MTKYLHFFSKGIFQVVHCFQAMNNILVLARENAGAELIHEKGGVPKLAQIINTEKNDEMILSAYRVLDELARDEQRVIKRL